MNGVQSRTVYIRLTGRSCSDSDQTASVISQSVWRQYIRQRGHSLCSRTFYCCKFDCRWSKANALKNAKLNLTPASVQKNCAYILDTLTGPGFDMEFLLTFSLFDRLREKHIKTHLRASNMPQNWRMSRRTFNFKLKA